MQLWRHHDDKVTVSGYGAAMIRRGWLLILCLLASSLVATGTVCASENGNPAAISCGGVTHADNDGDQVPSDSDKGAPHHHAACHGHSVTATPTSPSLSPIVVARVIPSGSYLARLARSTIDPALEPPKA